jgi:hypothetical protein
MELPKLFAGDTKSLDFFQTIDIYPIFFDKYLNQSIAKYIERKIERNKETKFITAYLENSGSTSVQISKLGPTQIVESNGFLTNFENVIKRNVKNIPIQNSGQPFEFLTADSILVVRGDNLDIGKLIIDLYVNGFSIQVIAIGVPDEVDDDFWKNAPIYGHQSHTVDMDDDLDLQSMLKSKYRFYQLVYQRILKKVHIHSFYVRKNRDVKTTKQKTFLRDISRTYQPVKINIEDDPDLDILTKHSFFNSYFPNKGPLPQTAMKMLGEYISQPVCAETMVQAVSLIKNTVPNLKNKCIHHYDYMSSITAIPLALECDALYTYSPSIVYDRIYNEVNPEIEMQNVILHREYNVLYHNSLPTSPNILMLNANGDQSHINEGDIIFTTYESKEMIESLLATKIPIYIVFLHPNLQLKKYKNMEFITDQMIDTRSSFENILKQMQKDKNLDQVFIDKVDEILSKKMYRTKISIYQANAKIKSTKSVPEPISVDEVTTQGGKFVILHQEPNQTKNDFDFLTEIAKILIQEFRKLSPESVTVLTHAIYNKIKDGVTYNDQIEKAIQFILPVVLKRFEK